VARRGMLAGSRLRVLRVLLAGGGSDEALRQGGRRPSRGGAAGRRPSARNLLSSAIVPEDTPAPTCCWRSWPQPVPQLRPWYGVRRDLAALPRLTARRLPSPDPALRRTIDVSASRWPWPIAPTAAGWSTGTPARRYVYGTSPRALQGHAG
jgi:hypothetical protein